MFYVSRNESKALLVIVYGDVSCLGCGHDDGGSISCGDSAGCMVQLVLVVRCGQIKCRQIFIEITLQKKNADGNCCKDNCT